MVSPLPKRLAVFVGDEFIVCVFKKLLFFIVVSEAHRATIAVRSILRVIVDDGFKHGNRRRV